MQHGSNFHSSIHFSVIDLEVVYAAKGQMLEPMKPAVPMQECQFSWHNATVERQDELKTLLTNISTAVRAIISCLSCKFTSMEFSSRVVKWIAKIAIIAKLRIAIAKKTQFRK